MSCDEYFCTNCGATLNEQPGFSPDCGMWTCTECGTLMMDDDIFDGDNYPGTAWICDNCGALLNRQYGFTDSDGSWRCTECGHLNGTTEDDILENKVFECPRCGDVLNNQSCFNRMDDDWTCSSCGAKLHHSNNDDDYEEVEEPKYKCPSCGAALDNQYCFSEYMNDWTCSVCGASLHHDYSGDDYEEVISSESSDNTESSYSTESKHRCPVCDEILEEQWDYSEDEEDWTCTECGAHLHHDYSDEEYEVVSETETKSQAKSYDSVGVSDYKYENDVVFDADYYRPTSSQSSTKSKQKIRKESKRSSNKESNAAQIIVAITVLILFVGVFGALLFESYIYLSKPTPTEDHTGEIRLTDSASAYKGQNYYDAIVKLHNQGLNDIRLTPLNDLKAGIFSKDGEIQTIEINGISDFVSGTWINEKAVVSITYHSFAKKEKAGYSVDKNNHLIIFNMDVQMPNYLIEEAKNDKQAIYHVKGDEETRFLLLNDSKQISEELRSFDTYYLMNEEDYSSSTFSGKELFLLGKKNDKVFAIRIISLKHQDENTALLVISPNNNKTDYSSDIKSIVSGIYVPKDTEIRIDFSIKDYKGKSYEEVTASLKSKGFDNIIENNLKDVLIGLFTKDGTVEKITINGKSDFKVGDWVDKQAEVIVSFHGKK